MADYITLLVTLFSTKTLTFKAGLTMDTNYKVQFNNTGIYLGGDVIAVVTPSLNLSPAKDVRIKANPKWSGTIWYLKVTGSYLKGKLLPSIPVNCHVGPVTKPRSRHALHGTYARHRSSHAQSF